MAAHARAVLADLLTALRTDLGDYDLSTTNSTPRVVIADGGVPPIGPPYLLISAPKCQITSQPGAPLTEYHVVGSLEWWAYVAATTESTEARALAALDFADEIVTAIQNAHHSSSFATLYALTILEADWDEVFADEPDIAPGMAIVHGAIRYETDLQRGG